MSELSKNFEPQQTDNKWYKHWMNKGYFHSTPDDKPENSYTIVMPPPNVTGVLHMGHALNNTIQDILIRRARMQGKNACWVPGTDHASIATEAKVVGMLRERGIAKSSLSRDEFLSYAWEWKEKYGGIILEQLKKLGCSLDWNRTTFTMDPDYYQSVINVFIDLYNKKLIYRGKRMINWDVKAKTALSDEEVIFKEMQSKLYFLNYKLADAEGHITIATVRPETILGDTAIFVNPNDRRYQHLIGKYALVPLINRSIPIMADEYVEMDFGTGALKVTPAHDKNDYALAEKYKLEIIDILNDDGTLNEAATLYIGEDRFDARKKIIQDLEKAGHLAKTEDYTNQIGYSERTNVVVEQKLSLQWWVSMKPLSTKALEVVMNDEIKFHPAKFKNLYRHWMEGIKDWCISRQLWWGHRIPAWYMPDGTYVVAATKEEAFEKFKIQNSKFKIEDLKQDEDCLDTWFSSWLWPFEVFKGMSNPGNKDITYYYPTNTLVTAPEIIFFWVARMIMAGEEYMHQIPFKDVYFTGIVRDKQGRKMSKSLGNSPDLLGLIDKYGADAVRFGIMIASPAGNDILFDESALEQGRNFNNKLWNALKLLKGFNVDEQKAQPPHCKTAINWFEEKLKQRLIYINEDFDKFRLSNALMSIYKLIWDDFCSWYLEMIKPHFRDGNAEPIDTITFNKTLYFLKNILELLHPFMPFITEEIWQIIKDDNSESSIVVSKWPKEKGCDLLKLSAAEQVFDLITQIRNFRNGKQISPKISLKLQIKKKLNEPENLNHFLAEYEPIIKKLSNLESISYDDIADKVSSVYVTKTYDFGIISTGIVNTEAERQVLQKDLEYQKGFLQSVQKKLSNEKFIANAKPEVIESERKKQADAEARIKAIEESLVSLN